MNQVTDDHRYVGIDEFKGIIAGDPELSFTFARSDMFRLSALMNARVMVYESRGRGGGNNTSVRHGYVLVSFMLCWVEVTKLGSCSVTLEKPPQSVSWTLSAALGSRQFVCLASLRPASLVVRPGIHKGATTVVMPRLRQRMISRRGTSQRAPFILLSLQ